MGKSTKINHSNVKTELSNEIGICRTGSKEVSKNVCTSVTRGASITEDQTLKAALPYLTC